MSLKTTISIFVTSMAPLLLVYFVINGIYILQLDGNTYIGEKADFDATAKFESYTLPCVACVVACAVLSIYIAMFCGRKGAEGHARRETVIKNVRKHDEGEMKWVDVNLLKDDMKIGKKAAKRFHFFDVDDGIGEVGPEGDSRDEDVEKRSQTSMRRF